MDLSKEDLQTIETGLVNKVVFWTFMMGVMLTLYAIVNTTGSIHSWVFRSMGLE